ncbi:MAG: DUF11 domain-containing protein, partial [Methanobrevibacter sp.]|nr:DUF11 domain-containing protein [Methanobrevibacter sp.]
GVDFSISDDNKTLTWIVDELTDSVEFYVTVRTALVGNLTNNVTVTSNENDTPVKDNETVEVVPVVLTVVKTANVTNVSLGGLVEFTMTITNEGLVDATNVNVTDILDSAFELQSIGNETYLKYSDAQKIVWNIPSLAAGDSAAVSVIVKVIKEGTFLNVVAVNCEENKTDVSNKTNVTSLPVVDLKINKTVDKNNVTVGDEVIYTITVINLGPSNATNVNVTENMIGNVEITDVDAEVGEYKDGIWYIGALSNGAIAKLTLTVKTLAVGIVQNIVSVNSSEDDNNNSNNKYPCENVTVNPAPSLVEGVNLTVYYGDPIVVDYTSTNATNVTYEIIDKDGKVVANGTVGPDGSIPVEQLPVGNYTVNWTTIVDENHIPATNVSTIEVLPIPTTVTIGNITGYPGENVTIPINVTTIDKKPFNGNVSVIMPDNSTQIVKVVNGTGNITWHIPEDYDPNRYPDVIRFPGDDVYEPSNGTGIIEVVKIPTHITVGNVTTFPGMEVTIPINVTADDGIPFNGNVTITFPDGTVKTVEIINGTGSTTWFVPSDYAPENYPDNVKFSGNGKYLPSEGNGTITVLEVPVPVDTNETVDNVTIPPVPGNHTHPIDEGKPPVKSPVKPKAVAKKALTKTGLAKYETGNPILALIMVLALFGINIRRRKQN